jgi:hypothetical protein
MGPSLFSAFGRFAIGGRLLDYHPIPKNLPRSPRPGRTWKAIGVSLKIMTDGREQDVGIDWLQKEFRCQVSRPVRRLNGKPGDNENREVGTLDLLVEQQIPTSDLLHAKVRDHQIRLVLMQEFQRLFAGFGGRDLPAFRREQAAQTFAHRRIIVDQENGRLVSFRDIGREDRVLSRLVRPRDVGMRSRRFVGRV